MDIKLKICYIKDTSCIKHEISKFIEYKIIKFNEFYDRSYFFVNLEIFDDQCIHYEKKVLLELIDKTNLRKTQISSIINNILEENFEIIIKELLKIKENICNKTCDSYYGSEATLMIYIDISYLLNISHTDNLDFMVIFEPENSDYIISYNLQNKILQQIRSAIYPNLS